MANPILIPGAITAKHIDALNKTILAPATLYNGNIVKLSTISTTHQYSQVYTVGKPATATLATDVFAIVNEPIRVLTTQGTYSYAGLNDDPRNFQIASGGVCNAFIPKVGDEFIISVDGTTGSYNATSAPYLVPADSTYTLTFAANTTGVCTGFLVTNASAFISVGNATRVSAYKVLCVLG